MIFVASGSALVSGGAAVGLRSGSMKSIYISGNDANLTIVTRAGYQSEPYKHKLKQLNYVLEVLKSARRVCRNSATIFTTP